MEITAEVHFAQLLASNQNPTRDKALKKLCKWLELKSQSEDAFTELGLLKLWKGLFYYFWNLDKPLTQERMAAYISSFIQKFHKPEYSILFIDTFFQTMAREWFGIDRYRLEKFMMFVRKFLNQCFQFLSDRSWNLEDIKQFRKCLGKSVTSIENKSDVDLKLHVIDIYMEELAKVGGKELSPQRMKSFLVPYCKMLALCENEVFLSSIRKNIFLYLLNQDADAEAFGDFPLLKFNPESIQTLLKKYEDRCKLSRNRKAITLTINRFASFIEMQEVGEEPPELIIPKKRRPIKTRAIKKAAEDLLKMDEEFAEEKLKWKKKRKVV